MEKGKKRQEIKENHYIVQECLKEWADHEGDIHVHEKLVTSKHYCSWAPVGSKSIDFIKDLYFSLTKNEKKRFQKWLYREMKQPLSRIVTRLKNNVKLKGLSTLQCWGR